LYIAAEEAILDSLSFSETRANLKAVMDRVVADRVPVTIRRRGENVVMVSQSEWEGMEETLYLLRSPANAKNLLESIAELDAGKGVERELIEK
jgi:antitoxin YefM